MRNSHMEFTMYLEAERNLKNKIQIGDGKKKRPTKLRQVLLHIGFASMNPPISSLRPTSRLPSRTSVRRYRYGRLVFHRMRILLWPIYFATRYPPRRKGIRPTDDMRSSRNCLLCLELAVHANLCIVRCVRHSKFR